MNKEIETILKKQFSIINVPYPKDEAYFLEDGWFLDNVWTREQEREFCEWLMEHLKKNWRGITAYRPRDKKQREKATMEWNLNYGFKTNAK